MNLVVITGRMTKDSEVRYNGENAVARFTLAVDRKFKKDGEASADFISCVAFGKKAEFLERYGIKGTKFNVTGEIRTGSYKNKDNQTVYTTDVIVNDIEFGESKSNNQQSIPAPSKPIADSNGFLTIPDGAQEELPFA